MRRLFRKLQMNPPGQKPLHTAEVAAAPQEWDDSGLKRGGLALGVPVLPSAAGLAWSSLDLASEGIVLLDGAGRITIANAQAMALMRCTLPAVIGRDFWDAVPEEIAELHQDATGMALSASGHHTFVGNMKFEGSWVEYTFRRQPFGYVVNLKDVAAAQELQRLAKGSERSSQLIFESNPNAMWVFDTASLKIVAVNQAALSFYGIPKKMFVGMQLSALFPDGEGSALLTALQPGNDMSTRLHLCKQQKMSGQAVLVELAWGQLNWNGYRAVLVSIADVSERHLADNGLRRENAALERALADQQGELENARRDLAAFRHALSTDLQGSLHVANGFAAMLAEKYADVLDTQGRRYVSRIQSSTRQLGRLVEDLRTLSQLSQHPLNMETIDLAAVCQPLVTELRKREPDRVVTVHLEAGQTLVCDKNLLTTALTCLLENAWKFTARKAEAWIKVGVLPGQQTGEVVLQVLDNGAGFDPTYSGKLFTAFQRLHSSADFPGNGLGLAIVKRVVELHGGRVWAETSGQAGASFFMAIRHDAQGAADAPEIAHMAALTPE